MTYNELVNVDLGLGGISGGELVLKHRELSDISGGELVLAYRELGGISGALQLFGSTHLHLPKRGPPGDQPCWRMTYRSSEILGHPLVITDNTPLARATCRGRGFCCGGALRVHHARQRDLRRRR